MTRSGRFDLASVSASPGTFDYAKLDWMNGVHLRALDAEDCADSLVLWVGEQGLDWPAERVHDAAAIVQEKIGRFDEFPAFAGFLSRRGTGSRAPSDPVVSGRGGARGRDGTP